MYLSLYEFWKSDCRNRQIYVTNSTPAVKKLTLVSSKTEVSSKELNNIWAHFKKVTIWNKAMHYVIRGTHVSKSSVMLSYCTK